jgi:hypothetical protein
VDAAHGRQFVYNCRHSPAKIADNLTPIGVIPQIERQARELVGAWMGTIVPKVSTISAAAAKIVDNLCAMAHTPLPKTESQDRELSGLEPICQPWLTFRFL